MDNNNNSNHDVLIKQLSSTSDLRTSGMIDDIKELQTICNGLKNDISELKYANAQQEKDIRNLENISYYVYKVSYVETNPVLYQDEMIVLTKVFIPINMQTPYGIALCLKKSLSYPACCFLSNFTAFDYKNNTVLQEFSWPSGRIFEISNTEIRTLIKHKDDFVRESGFCLDFILCGGMLGCTYYITIHDGGNRTGETYIKLHKK